MSDLFKKTLRGYLIDHHSPEAPTITLENLNIDDYEEFFKKANINNLMMYTKDHWGYSYYDTKIGTRHPSLKEDWVGKIAKLTKKMNIEFNAYYCIEYDCLAPSQNPSWSTKDKDGNDFILVGRMAKWKIPCVETGYRKYVLEQLKEVVSNYEPDSLFLDIFGKSLCYCENCKKQFKEEYGYDLPESDKVLHLETDSFDFGEKGSDVNEFLENQEVKFLDEVLKTVKEIDPNLKVTINFSALYPKKIRDMLDYQFTEPWAGNWLSSAYSRDTAVGQYPQLGPGDVSEVYNYRADSIYELAAAQIVSQGCRLFMYSGSQRIDGTLEMLEADKVGNANNKIEKYEKYLYDRRVKADIAIIQSDLSSRAKAGNLVVANSIGRCKYSDVHRKSILGAMKLCDKSKKTWKIIPEQNVCEKTLEDIKVLILAGTFHINDNLKSQIEAFLKKGGMVISDGSSGLYSSKGNLLENYVISDVFGVKFKKVLDDYKTSEWGGYLKTSNSTIWNDSQIKKTTPPMTNTQFGVEATTGNVIAEILFPTVALTDTTWVNWWCPPPKLDSSGFPGIVENNFGSGKSIFIAEDFFFCSNDNMFMNYEIFSNLLNYVLPEPDIFIETKYNNSLGMVAYEKDDSIILHELSHIPETNDGDAPEIQGGILFISKKYKNVSSVKMVFPTEKELTVESNNDKYYTVNLPMIDLHNLFLIS